MINITNSRINRIATAGLPAGVVVSNSVVLKRAAEGVAPSAGAAGEDIVGIAKVSPIAPANRTVWQEEHTLDANGTIVLPWTPVAEPAVFNKTTNMAMPAGNITLTGSTLSWTAAPPAADDVLLVTGLRSMTLAEMSLEGFPMDFANKINGADGAVDFVTGQSNIEVDFFDPAGTYTIGATLYSDANGMITTTAGTSLPVGKVAKVPTTDDPTLGVAINLNY